MSKSIPWKLPPLFIRQLRINSRRRNSRDLGGWAVVSSVLLTIVLFFFLRMAPSAFVEAAANAVLGVLCLQVLFFQVACLGGVALINEHEDNTLTGLTISNMSPGRIIWGFWLHSMWIALSIVLYSAPVFALLYWWGGMTIPEYIRSQWLLVAYCSMLGMVSITTGLLLVNTLDRTKRDRDQKKERSGLGMIGNLIKNANTQNTSQGVVVMVFLAFLFFPMFVGLVGSFVIAVNTFGLNRMLSLGEALNVGANQWAAISLFVPALAGYLDVCVNFLGYPIAAWWAFPIFYLVATYGLFLQARYYLVVRQFNTSSDFRLSLMLFHIIAVIILVGLFWQEELILVWVLALYCMASYLFFCVQCCLTADDLPEWGVLGDPEFPHQKFFNHFYSTGPRFTLWMLAPLLASVLALAFSYNNYQFIWYLSQSLVITLISIGSLTVLGRSLIYRGYAPKTAHIFIVVISCLAAVISMYSFGLTQVPAFSFLSNNSIAWLTVGTTGIFPMALVVEGVLKSYDLAIGQSVSWQLSSDNLKFVEQTIGGATERTMIAMGLWVVFVFGIAYRSRRKFKQRLSDHYEMVAKIKSGKSDDIEDTIKEYS